MSAFCESCGPGPEVIRLQGEDLDDLIGELQAAKGWGYARVMIQDHGVKVASGRCTWSLQYGVPNVADGPVLISKDWGEF